MKDTEAKSTNKGNVQDLDQIRHLLSHLHDEIADLSSSYTEVLRVLQRFENLCSRDEMTQLLRRESFFQKWMESAQECLVGAGETLGIIAVDIDHFKKINDTYGHSTGDAVIQRVAGLLREFEGADVFAARFGGEEFILGIRAESQDEIMEIAERIRMRAEFCPQDLPPATISVGVAVAEPEALRLAVDRGSEKEIAQALIEQADQALYAAKRSGRNCVRIAA